MDLWPKMGALGVLGVTVGDAYGGAGMGYLAPHGGDGRDQPRFGQRGPELRRPQQPVCQSDPAPCSEAQREKYLPPLIRGEHVGALAMSEPEAGSDVLAIEAA